MIFIVNIPIYRCSIVFLAEAMEKAYFEEDGE